MKNLCLFSLVFLFAATSCGNKSGGASETQSVESDATESPSSYSSATTTNSSKTATGQNSKKTILFFGDSLTAGLGLEEEEAFPALIQDRIDSLNLDYQVINAGLSGETSAGGKGRIEWVLNRPIDIFVLELGANDMLRGLALEETEKNLRGILDKVKELSPDASIVIAGMEAPANMGPDYTKGFKSMYARLAKDYNAAFIPFLLEGLMGRPEMSIGDGKHPNAEGQKVVRDNVWKVLKEYI